MEWYMYVLVFALAAIAVFIVCMVKGPKPAVKQVSGSESKEDPPPPVQPVPPPPPPPPVVIVSHATSAEEAAALQAECPPGTTLYLTQSFSGVTAELVQVTGASRDSAWIGLPKQPDDALVMVLTGTLNHGWAAWLQSQRSLMRDGVVQMLASAPSFLRGRTIPDYPLPVYEAVAFPEGADPNSPYFCTQGFPSSWVATGATWNALQDAAARMSTLQAVGAGWAAAMALVAAAIQVEVKPASESILASDRTEVADRVDEAAGYVLADGEAAFELDWPDLPEDATMCFWDDPFELVEEEPFKFGESEQS